MTTVDIKGLAKEICRMNEEDWRGPFPREDCRYLIDENGDERFQDLYFDLDMYFAEIAAFSGSAQRILYLSKEKLMELKGRITASFFEEYPQYKLLEPQITESDTPDLYERIGVSEKIRLELLKLISILLNEQ